MSFVTHDELVTFLQTYQKITGLTHRQMMEHVGIHYSTIQRILKGNQQMDMPTYEKLMNHFQNLGRQSHAGSD